MANLFPYQLDDWALREPSPAVTAAVATATQQEFQKYHDITAAAAAFLGGGHSDASAEGLRRLIAMCGPSRNAADIPVSPAVAAANAAALSRVPPSDLGRGLIEAAAKVWAATGVAATGRLKDIAKRTETSVSLPGGAFTQDWYNAAVRVLQGVYNIVLDRTRNTQEQREWCNQIAELGIAPLAHLVRITACNTRSDPIVAAWVMSSYLVDVHPHVERIHEIVMAGYPMAPDIERTGYLALLHGEDGKEILNLNARLHHYLSDIGGKQDGKQDGKQEFAVMTQAEIDRMDPMQRLKQYAANVYILYKLIVRDVVLFSFRAKTNSLSPDIQAKWAQLQVQSVGRITTVAAFLHALFFMDLTADLVGPRYTSAEEVRAVATAQNARVEISTTEPRPLLQRSLGDELYQKFIREAAMDCVGDIPGAQVRIERLLRYMARDAIVNVPVGGETGPIYRDIMRVLNMVSAHIHGMGPAILKVFDLIHSDKSYDQDYSAGGVVSYVVVRNDYRDGGNRRYRITVDHPKTPRSVMIDFETQPHMLYGAQRARRQRRQLKTGAGARQQILDQYIARVSGGETPAERKAREQRERKAAIAEYHAQKAARESAVAAAAAAEDERRRAAAATKAAAAKHEAELKRAAEAERMRMEAALRYLAGLGQNPDREDGVQDESVTGDRRIPWGATRKYVYGPFTRVFLPLPGGDQAFNISHPKGDDSASIQENVVKKLADGNSVCIFGYGQSGAGKTSLLVYHQPDGAPGRVGVMGHVCNQLAGVYDRVTVAIREIGVQPGTAGPTVLDSKTYPDAEFVTQNGGWVMPIKADKGQKVALELGKYVVDTTETRRLTRATTNNPVSSRTHVLVFLRFSSGKVQGPTLIICDFAGIENTFQCADAGVMRSFAEIETAPGSLAYKKVIDDEFERQVLSLVRGSVFDRSYSEIKGMQQYGSTSITPGCRAFAQTLLAESRGGFAGSTLAEAIRQTRELRGAFNAARQYVVPSTDSHDKGAFPITHLYGPLYKTNELVNIMAVATGVSQVELVVSSGKRFFPILPSYAKEAYGVVAIAKAVRPNMQDIGGLHRLDILLYELLLVTPQLFMANECRMRVQEGAFINASLDAWRTTMSEVLSARGESPHVLPACAAMQCNPFYNDCFGSMYTDESTPGATKGVRVDLIRDTIVEQLGSPEALLGLKFCMFNVINVSKDRSLAKSTCNDPPPVPYIDLGRLLHEFNRVVSSVSREGAPVRFRPDVLTRLRRIVEELDAAAQSAASINPAAPELTQAAANTTETRRTIDLAISRAIANVLPEGSQTTLLASVRDLIVTIERSNAPSLMGTMAFADTVAKFGLLRNTCTFPDRENADYMKEDMLVNVENMFAELDRGFRPLSV